MVKSISQFSRSVMPESSVPSGGGGHEHEPVSPIFMLSGPARGVPGLHGSLLHCLEIHQAEVQPRLVKASGCFSTTTRLEDYITHTEFFLFSSTAIVLKI